MRIDSSLFPGNTRFQVLRLLGEGGMGAVYEALDREQNAHVALKTLRTVDPEALLRFKQEFRTVQDVVHTNLVRLGELLEDAGHWFFTMELVEGTDLLTYVKLGTDETQDSVAAGTPVPMRTLDTLRSPDLLRSPDPRRSAEPFHVLENQPTSDTATVQNMRMLDAEGDSLAGPRRFSEPRLREAFAQLAEGLDGLHRSHLVHRDVKPSNVLVGPSGRVVILDFGIASEITGATETHLIGTGTLAFMAPEQLSGGILRPASDWYAVGVTLYLSLTGQLPHRGKSAGQLNWKKLHAPPRPPHTLCTDVPTDLEELCLELLQPDPAARPVGDEVVRRLREGSGLAKARRRPKTLQPTFFGRASELEALATALADSRASGAVTVLVTGDSGIGKSALVRRLRSAAMARHPDALELSGRCHERESVPYKAVDGVIDALSRHLGRLPDSEVESLLPPSIGALGQVFPVLCRVPAIARREAMAPRLESADARRRIFGALRELFAQLGERAPLVLLIDDLQWAEADSMALLEEVLRPPGPRLLLVATLRGPADSPVALNGIAVRRIHLLPLPAADAQQLAMRYLCEAGAAHAALAETVALESSGHPLFIAELARHLASAVGQHAAPEAERLAPTQLRLDDALRLRMGSLDEPTRRVLELVAIASVPVPLSLIADVAGMAFDELAGRVATLRAGRLLRTSGARPTDRAESYHDRISESLRAGMPAEAVREWHRRLAVALEPLASSTPELLSLHFAGAGDALRAARYAVRAAIEAGRVLAFASALRHCETGIALLPPDAWQHEYALAQQLHALGVHAGCSAENFVRTHELAALLRAHGRTPLDRAPAYEAETRALWAQGKHNEVVDLCLAGLADLGLRLPRDPSTSTMLRSMVWTVLRVRGRSVAELTSLPALTDPVQLAAMRLFEICETPILHTSQKLLALMALHFVNITLDHGVAPASLGAFVAFAMVLCSPLGARRFGNRMGDVAEALMVKTGGPSHGKALAMLQYGVRHWKQPVRDSFPLLLQAARDAMEVGDLEYGTLAPCFYCLHSIYAGVELPALKRECEEYSLAIRRTGQLPATGFMARVRQCILNLTGEGDTPWILIGEALDENVILSRFERNGAWMQYAAFMVEKVALADIFARPTEGLEYLARLEPHKKHLAGIFRVTMWHFHGALVRLAASDETRGRERRWLIEQASASFRKLSRWSKDAPMNYLHCARLVEAELARVRGDSHTAARAYQDSIRLARAHRFISDEALANERAARFHLQAGRHRAGHEYLIEAQRAWLRWGATAKVRLLAREFPVLTEATC